ncbi:D-Ala-D-Ala carboxypeptidase family metallohydrolase [Shewanella algae]|uniref:D-Ala-D-Ala carboxypeptidase family metallohydrolase n=1 Tax=Shewanella algae TaxID=38313 RepID=UPI0039E7FB79
MYVCKHFKIYELVDKKTYNDRGEKAWQLFDPRLLKLLDQLRELFDAPITVNNWFWGGQFSNRGLRTSASSYYRPYSQHSFGRAVDFDVKGLTADESREKIRHWFSSELLDIDGIRMELGVNWVHLDVANCSGIIEFYP